MTYVFNRHKPTCLEESNIKDMRTLSICQDFNTIYFR